MKADTIAAVSSHLKGEQTGITSLTRLRDVAGGNTIPTKPKGNFWDARKIIDTVYNDATKGKAFTDESLQGAKAGYASLRGTFKDFLSESFRYPGQMDKVNAVNEFLKTPQAMKMNKAGWSVPDIESQFGLTPNPTSVKNADLWNAHMDTLSGLYKAQDTLASKISSEKSLTGLGAFQVKHPLVSGILKTGAEAAGVGAAGGTAYGLLSGK
jgi:hypothetical protein